MILKLYTKFYRKVQSCFLLDQLQIQNQNHNFCKFFKQMINLSWGLDAKKNKQKPPKQNVGTEIKNRIYAIYSVYNIYIYLGIYTNYLQI